MDKVVSLLIMTYFSYKFIKIQADNQLLRLQQYLDKNLEKKDGDFDSFF